MPSFLEDAIEEWHEEAHDVPASIASYLQGTEPQAKQSTRYLARGSVITSCNVDLSQYRSNMTVGTRSVYENASTRFNHSHPRTILLRVEANSTDQLNLWRHGTGADLELLRFRAGGGSLEIFTNNTSRLTLTITGLGTTRSRMIVAWTSEANPDTTGAGDAVLSTLEWWNLETGAHDKASVAHPTKGLGSFQAVWGAADNIGTNAFTGVITGVLYENRRMSATEIAADWVTPVLALSSSLDVDLQGLPPQSATIDAANHWHGPAACWAADATRRMQRRTLSYFVNDRCRVRPSWQTTTLDGPFVRQQTGATAWRMPLGHLRVVPVPDTCNAIAIRVHARCWPTSGEAVPTGIRVYSMNRPPGINGLALGGGEAFAQFYATALVTRDDTASIGEWIDFEPIPIARGSSGIRRGKTYIGIAIAIDPDGTSTNDANARVAINAVHASPGFSDPAGGGQFGGLLP